MIMNWHRIPNLNDQSDWRILIYWIINLATLTPILRLTEYWTKIQLEMDACSEALLLCTIGKNFI